ncbi:MAG: hypothetical protein PHV37_08745 [Candidatus Gastranaerophilales bacterium]|nr:hypothetical protein [Candidatus Gastranaerophilales bacterium]
MKKYNIIFLISSISFLIIIFAIKLLFYYQSQKTAYIYIDTATFATLQEMISYSKVPEKSPKFVFWYRFYPLKNRINLKRYNTIEEIAKSKQPATLDNDLKKFYNLHKKSNFILHLNLNHRNEIMAVLSVIPYSKIQEIHLYEDSMGRMALPGGLNNLKIFSKYREKTIIHVSMFERVSSKNCEKDFYCNRQKNALANYKTIPFDLENTAASLSARDKKKLYRLTGFDYKKYKNYFKKHPSIIFLTGFWDNEAKVDENLKYLKEIRSGEKQFLLENKAYNWFYKEHPHQGKHSYFDENLSKLYPDMIPIDYNIPFEMFVLFGLMPDKVICINSSVILSVPISNILIYIPVKNYRVERLLNEKIKLENK